jgi:hypothetical protein
MPPATPAIRLSVSDRVMRDVSMASSLFP